MKINIDDAEKDAHIFAEKVGNWLGEIMFDLIGICNQEWIKIETGIDGLRQAMYGVNATLKLGQMLAKK